MYLSIRTTSFSNAAAIYEYRKFFGSFLSFLYETKLDIEVSVDVIISNRTFRNETTDPEFTIEFRAIDSEGLRPRTSFGNDSDLLKKEETIHEMFTAYLQGFLSKACPEVEYSTGMYFRQQK